MKVTIYTLAYDTDKPDSSGTGCEVFVNQESLHARLKQIMERDIINTIPGCTVNELLHAGKIQESWDIWSDCDNGMRDPMDTYTVDEHEIDVPVRDGFPVHGFCEPEGDHGKKELPVVHWANSIASDGPYATTAGAHLDWYNDRLQLCVDDGVCDDVALHVRYNTDGTIAEILVRDDLMRLVKPDLSEEDSAWQKERDER